MCTVTVVPLSHSLQHSHIETSGQKRAGFRIACNRDESETRAAALPPKIHKFGDRRAILPVDPVSGGTWVAVNDAGLAMALLNFNPQRIMPVSSQKSRGEIIPLLLEATTLHEAIERMAAIEVSEYSLFRLILVDDSLCVEFRTENASLRRCERTPIDRPLLFTSSGLGDDFVETPRRKLFESMFQKRAKWLHDQDRFHRHWWPGREHLSVCMSRANARTVSRTIVTIQPSVVTMSYASIPSDNSLRAEQLTVNRMI